MASRLNESLMAGRAFSRGNQSAMLSPIYGGQMGFAPDLREWVNNAAYVQRNVIPILVEAPRFFQYFDDAPVWISCLRSMMELHPRSIEGLNLGLKVDTDSTPVGGAGEIQQEFTNVTRVRSEPVFTWDERYGRPYFNLLEYWITYGMMDPATKVANIGTLAGARPTDMLPDQYAMTMLFIEPDPLHRYVNKAWLCTNMFPTDTGDSTGKRDLTTAMTLQSMSIPFTALTQTGLGVNVIAQRMLDAINITNANPNLRAAFLQEIARDVATATKGYANQTAEFGRSAVQPA